MTNSGQAVQLGNLNGLKQAGYYTRNQLGQLNNSLGTYRDPGNPCQSYGQRNALSNFRNKSLMYIGSGGAFNGFQIYASQPYLSMYNPGYSVQGSMNFQSYPNISGYIISAGYSVYYGGGGPGSPGDAQYSPVTPGGAGGPCIYFTNGIQHISALTAPTSYFSPGGGGGGGGGRIDIQRWDIADRGTHNITGEFPGGGGGGGAGSPGGPGGSGGYCPPYGYNSPSGQPGYYSYGFHGGAGGSGLQAGYVFASGTGGTGGPQGGAGSAGQPTSNFNQDFDDGTYGHKHVQIVGYPGGPGGPGGIPISGGPVDYRSY